MNASINQTLARSINTSLTTFFAAGALYFFGGSTIKDFTLPLVVGIIMRDLHVDLLRGTALVVLQTERASSRAA